MAVDLFRTQGFARTTVSQIAEAADIVPATFFNHFQSKNALLGQMTIEVLGIIEIMLADEVKATQSTCERLTRFTSQLGCPGLAGVLRMIASVRDAGALP